MLLYYDKVMCFTITYGLFVSFFIFIFYIHICLNRSKNYLGTLLVKYGRRRALGLEVVVGFN